MKKSKVLEKGKHYTINTANCGKVIFLCLVDVTATNFNDDNNKRVFKIIYHNREKCDYCSYNGFCFSTIYDYFVNGRPIKEFC